MSKNTQIILGVIALIIVGLFVSKFGRPAPKNAGNTPEPIQIGVILPLTGSGADQGEWVKQGLDLAVQEINASGTQKFNLLYEDSQGDPKNAVSVYQKLTTQYRLPAVITWGSGVGLALSPLVNKDKIIQMGVATASPGYSSPGDYTFRNFPSSNIESDYLVNVVLNSLKTKEIAILKINNDYGTGSANSFKVAYEKNGGKILKVESFEPNATDFRTQLTKLKALDPNFIFLASYPKEGALLLKQAKELGLSSKFIASVAILGGKDFFNLAGNSADGLIIATSVPVFNGNSDPAVQSFVAKYQDAYHQAPTAQQLYAARSYDALKVLAGAMKTCNDDTNCIKDELFKVKDYHGAGGTVTFDNNGDIAANFNLQVIKDGNVVNYQP